MRRRRPKGCELRQVRIRLTQEALAIRDKISSLTGMKKSDVVTDAMMFYEQYWEDDLAERELEELNHELRRVELTSAYLKKKLDELLKAAGEMDNNIVDRDGGK